MTKGWCERGPRTLYSFGNDSTWIHHLPEFVAAMNCLHRVKRVPKLGPYSWLRSWPHQTLRMSILLLFVSDPIHIWWELNFLFFKLFLLEGLLLWECILEYLFYFWLVRESNVLSEVVECPHHVLQWHIFSFKFGDEDA